MKIRHGGRQLSLSELARITTIPYRILRRRYQRGDRGLVLVRPIQTRRRV